MATDRAIENAEKIIKLTEEREAQTQKIKDLLKDIDKLSGAALDKRKEDIKEAKIILQVKSKELKISQGLTDTQEELLSLTDKEAVLAFDIAGYKKQAKKTADQIRKLSVIDTDEARKKVKELKKQAAETHGMFKSKEKEISAAQANQQIQEKLLGTIGLSTGAMSGLVAQARLFTLALLKNPLLLGAAALLGVVMALKKAVTFGLELQDTLGTSAAQSVKITSEFADPKALAQLKLLGVNVKENIQAFGDAFGDVNLATTENLIALGKQKRLLGISEADAIKLSKTFMDMTGSTFETAMNFQTVTGQMAEANGLRPGDVVKDLAQNTETFAEFAKDGGANLAKAAIQARKLGMSLSTTAKIADSLLDFESSIEKEMEASLMIGKQLNFNRARALALEGDIAGAAADIAAQVGGPEALNQMNVLQRRALADSIGVSVEELSKLASGKLDVKSDMKSPQENMVDEMKKTYDQNKFLINTMSGLTAAVVANTLVHGAKAIKNFFGKGGTGANAMTKAGNFMRGGPKALPYEKSGASFKGIKKAEYLKNVKAGQAANRASNLAKVGIGKQGFKTVGGKLLGAGGVANVAMGGLDIYKGVKSGDKGAVGGGAGAIIGGAIGAFGGPLGIALGSMIGQAAGEFIGKKLEKNETLEQKQKEKEDANAKVLKETADLNKEDQAMVAAAMNGGAEEMKKLVAQFDSWRPWDDKDQVAEALKVLIAKEEELIRKQEESKKAISDLTLE